MIIGHRGAKALAPENTLAGIKKVMDFNVKWVEVDIQLSQDQIPVVFHDETLERCTNGSGLLAENSLSDLKKLDVSHPFSSEFKGETIPTLEELLVMCEVNNIGINLEIKIHHDQQMLPLVKKIVEVILRLNFPLEQLIISSFSIAAVAEIKKQLPHVRRGLIMDKKSENLPKAVSELELYSLHIDHQLLTETFTKSLKDLGIVLIVWTVNLKNDLDKYAKWGVDHIITDHPDLF